MSLHPIKALDHVLEEYRDYLLTEFRAKDPNLRGALERELDAPRFLAQEPFFQAHRPFKTGKAWRELPLDQRLAQAIEQRSGTRSAYLHQSHAIDELRSANPQPIVVTTGTGSGKTEAFLLPVIQNAFDDAVRFEKHGLTERRSDRQLDRGGQLAAGACHPDCHRGLGRRCVWEAGDESGRYAMVSLAFIDSSLLGSGYLERVAENLHHVASRAIDHLDHRDCETACYRCLKSYYNQRYHEQLAWPQALPALEGCGDVQERH